MKNQSLQDKMHMMTPNINVRTESANTTAAKPKVALTHFIPDLSQSQPAWQSRQ